MTIAALIAYLQTCDPEKPVGIWLYEYDWYVEVQKVAKRTRVMNDREPNKKAKSGVGLRY
jgi:hypothetical protein